MRIEEYAALSVALTRSWEKYWKFFLGLLVAVIIGTIVTRSILAVVIGVFIYWLAQFICVTCTHIDQKEIDRYLK